MVIVCALSRDKKGWSSLKYVPENTPFAYTAPLTTNTPITRPPPPPHHTRTKSHPGQQFDRVDQIIHQPHRCAKLSEGHLSLCDEGCFDGVVMIHVYRYGYINRHVSMYAKVGNNVYVLCVQKCICTAHTTMYILCTIPPPPTCLVNKCLVCLTLHKPTRKPCRSTIKAGFREHAIAIKQVVHVFKGPWAVFDVHAIEPGGEGAIGKLQWYFSGLYIGEVGG